jgi:hypothetical protein
MGEEDDDNLRIEKHDAFKHTVSIKLSLDCL